MTKGRPWAELPARRLSRRRLLALGASAGIGAAGLALVGCGDDDDGGQPGGLSTVSLALDWVPNTNHTGFYVADAMGWYEDAGVRLDILPYADTSPDVLVDAGTADFGISFATSVPLSVSAGLSLTSVMAILQRPASALVVRADRDDIRSPKDLDGKLYAGFGAPFEEPMISQIIQADGGRGEFETVTLSTFAYDAVNSGDADFAWAFVTWEGVQQELLGEPFRELHFRDFGFPEWYAVVLIGNPNWLGDHPDLARAFVQASQRGFEFAARRPEEAAGILIDKNPGVFTEPELPVASAALLAGEFYLNEDGNFGTQTLQKWTDLPRFLFEIGALTDENGDPLQREPDYSRFFTNAFLS